jgi:hypothetical protein
LIDDEMSCSCQQLQSWLPKSCTLAAERRVYQKGEYVQGGGHAFSAALIRAASSRHLLDDPFLFFLTRIPDDLVLTIMSYALDFIALDYNSPGEVFAVINNGLPGSPDSLFNAGYAIAHSVKADSKWPETEIRERFSKLGRQGKISK